MQRCIRGKVLLAIFLLLTFAGQKVSAIQIVDDGLGDNDESSTWRFIAGIGTATPTPNTDSNFVLLGYNLSGLGGTGWGGTGRLHSDALISPISLEGAWHNHFGPGATIDFFSGVTVNGTQEEETVQVANSVNPTGDMNIEILSQPVSASSNLQILPVLDISSGDYSGQPMIITGSSGTTASPADTYSSGTQQFATATVAGLSGTYGSDTGLLEVNGYDGPPSTLTYEDSESGDSGSPELITYDGQLTIAGATYLSDATASTLLNSPGNENNSALANASMAPYGYTITWLIYDNPINDPTNTANVWTGAAGSAFGNSSNWTVNWTDGAVPDGVPVVFDSGAANGEWTINLGTSQSVRGILFREPTGGSTTGFTFDSGTLWLGLDGISNEDSNTQTFNSAIALNASQNWQATNGNMIFNGNIANNGYLLVAEGADNITINGAISGLGGFAKDDSGTVTLNGVNTYAGTTFLHNGTLVIGVNNALPTGTAVQFDVNNPAVLNLNGFTQTVGDIQSIDSGTGTIIMDGGTLSTGADNLATTYSGVFTGSGSLNKIGLGTWTLSGNNAAYSGNITVSGGVLRLAGTDTGTGSVTIDSGGTLTGIGGTGEGVTLNSGSFLSPGVNGVGTLTAGGLTWNSGDMDFALGAPGTSDVLNLGTNTLTKGGAVGEYAFTFSNANGLAPGLYTLIDFGSTNFTASNFGYTNTGGFSGYFIINAGDLQFEVTNAGSLPVQGGWVNTPTYDLPLYSGQLPAAAVYENTTNWLNGVINNVFTENVQGTYNQTVLFNAPTTLTGGLTINANTLTQSNLTSLAETGWFFLSETSTPETLTLKGNLSVNNIYESLSSLAPTAGFNGNIGNTVALGEAASGLSGYNLNAVDLGGASRTITTDLGGDPGRAYDGFFIDAPITDSGNTGSGITKLGNGNLMLGGINTYLGATNIQAGILTLLDNGKLASNNIDISNGAELFLDSDSSDINLSDLNTSSSNTVVNNRLTSGSLVLNLYGGDISFQGGDSGTAETQNLGTVNALQGVSMLQAVSEGSADDNATLEITALNRSVGATLYLPELTVGTVATGGNYVTAGEINGSTPVSGIVIPWAYIGSSGSGQQTMGISGFAVYNSTNGFQLESATTDTNYIAGTNFSGVTVASDYQLTTNDALTGSTEVNSLEVNAGFALTSSGGPYTLTLGDGGLLFLGGATVGSTTVASNLDLNFNGQEATIAISGGSNQGTIYGTIADANGLTITAASGSSSVSSIWLDAANPYNSNNTLTQYDWGSTYVDSGRLVLENANALPNTGDVTLNVSTNGVNPGSGAVVSIPAVLDLDGNSVTIGGLNGGGIVALSSLITGKFPTNVSSGTLTLGNGGNSGSFSGEIQNTLLLQLPYGADQGNQLSVYGTTPTNIALGVIKTGAGTETFSGVNTYTGATTINGGTLALNGDGTAGSDSALTLSGTGSTFDVSGSTGTAVIGSLTGAIGTIVNLGENILSVGGNNTNTTFSGTFNGAGGGLLKIGTGEFTINGINDATGSTTVDDGILLLNHATNTASMLSATSSLILGGGTLYIYGNGTTGTTDTADGLVVNQGGSAIEVESLNQSTTLGLGAITRNEGGTVDFNTSGSGASIATSNTGGTILGGWATVNSMTDWAAVSGGKIVAASSVGGIETVSDNASDWTTNANVIDDSAGFSGTAGSGASINSLLFEGAQGSSINLGGTLTINSGGILETAAVGNNASTITGGILATGNGQDLIITQNDTAGSLTIGSTIEGSGGLTKAGAGELILSGTDIYYGPTSINGGTLALTGSTTLGSGSALNVSQGAIADLAGSSAAQTFTSITGEGSIVDGAGGISLGADNSSSEFDGMISGSGSLTKNGTGTFTLTGLNTYSGATILNGGTLAVTGLGTLGINSDVTINSANSVPAVLNLAQAASAISIGSLSGDGNLILSPAGMTIGTDNTSTTFSGEIAGIGGFTKVGTGTLTLTGTNWGAPDTQYGITTEGGETVNQGTLVLNYTTNATDEVAPSNEIEPNGYLNLGGGSIVGLGNAATAFTQSNGYYTYINPGASSINVSTPAYGTANFTLEVTHLSRSAGGTVDFTTTSGGGGGVAAITTFTANTNGIIGGWATANGMSDFATNQDGTIVALTPSVSAGVAGSNMVATSDYYYYAGDPYIEFYDNSASSAVVGEPVYGPGIPIGTTVTSVEASFDEIMISQDPTENEYGSVSMTLGGLTVSDPGQFTVGETVTGTNIPAGTTIVEIVGDYIVLSNEPTGSTAQLNAPGYSEGTTNDLGVTIATLDNPANWTTSNDSDITTANVTDDGTAINGSISANTTINSLKINAAGASTIGIGSGDTLTLTSGGLLETSNVGANGVTINGPGKITSGNNADLIVLQNNTGAGMAINAVISGSIGLTKSGAGLLTLGSTNTYTGATTINSGTVALSGAATIGNGTASNATAVTVMSGATLDLSGSSAAQYFGSLSSIPVGGGVGGGNVLLNNSNLTVGSNNTSTVFSGVIENGGSTTAGLTKTGTGNLVLGGNNTYAGATSVNSGGLFLDGGSLASSGAVNVGNGTAVATFGGIGSAGNLTVNSTSATNYGILEVGLLANTPFTLATAGTLTTHNLTFNGPYAQVDFLLGSSAQLGETYSTVAVNGNLNLDNATLNILTSSDFGVGTYDLFSYTGIETGTLNLSLPTGYNSDQFSLSYGNDQVDLEVTAVPEPSTWTMIWGGLLLLGAVRKFRSFRCV